MSYTKQEKIEAYAFILLAFIYYVVLVMGYQLTYNAILSLKDVNIKNSIFQDLLEV